MCFLRDHHEMHRSNRVYVTKREDLAALVYLFTRGLPGQPCRHYNSDRTRAESMEGGWVFSHRRHLVTGAS